MSGCLLFESSKKVSYAIRSFGCLILVIYTFVTIRFVSYGRTPLGSSQLLLLMFKVWEVSYNTMAISTIFIVWFMRRRLLQILWKVSSFLRNQDRKRLRLISLILLVYKLIFQIIFRGYSYFFNFRRSQLLSSGFWTDLSSIVLLVIKSHDWELVVISLFIIFLQVIHLAERNIMNVLHQNLDKVEPTLLYKQVHRILFLKQSFIDSMSLLPLFLYGYIFFEFVFCIVRHYSTVETASVISEEKLSAIILIVRTIMTIIHDVLLILYTHHLAGQSRRQFINLEYEINTKHSHLQKKYVMHLIHEAERFEYRAADFFVINRELLVSFCAAFLTFTVLFVQLINQSK